MEMCDYGHDQICHDERKCPLCDALEEIQNKDEEVAELEDQLTELQREVDMLQTINDKLISM